ncbi:MAG: hypothetical protein WCV90_06405 [Candidatus Woesearchaeota archaeon]
MSIRKYFVSIAAATVLLGGLACTKIGSTADTLLGMALDNPNYLRMEQRDTGVANTAFKDKTTGNLVYTLLRDGFEGTVTEYFDLNHNGQVDGEDYFARVKVLRGIDCEGSDSGCLDEECTLCSMVDCFTHYPQTVSTKPLKAVTTAADPLTLYPASQVDLISRYKVQSPREIALCVINGARELNQTYSVVVDPNLLP